MVVPIVSGRFYSPNQQQFFDGSSLEYPGGKLFFYATGTAAPQNTYQDAGLTVVNPNPVILDSAGRAGNIFMSRLLYKVVLHDVDDNLIWTADPVSGAATLADIYALYTLIDGFDTEITDINNKIIDLTARVVALEALELSFGDFGGVGNHGAWAWVDYPIAAAHGGPITIRLAWGSESAINAAENRVVPIPFSYSTPAYIVTLGPNGVDATPMFEINTKIVNSFTVSNRSAGSMDVEFMLLGAL